LQGALDRKGVKQTGVKNVLGINRKIYKPYAVILYSLKAAFSEPKHVAVLGMLLINTLVVLGGF
jgi:hypothetical protein